MRKWIYIVLAVLIVTPLALVGTLLYTPAGLSMVASQLGRLEHYGVRIEGLSGTLAGPLYIKRFELDKPNVHIVSNDIVVWVRIRELLVQTVHVSSFTARDTLVEIRNAPTPPSDKPPHFLPGFLRVDVRGMDLTGLRYVNVDGTAVDATRLRGRVRISPSLLRIREFQVEAPRFNLAGEGRLVAQRPLGLEMRVNGNLHLERGTEVAASVQTSGTIDQLAIQATVLRPDVVNVDAMFTRPDNHWHINGSVAAPAISLQPWMEKPPFSFRNVALKVDARADGIRAAGNIGIPEWSGRDFTVDIHGKYAHRVLQLGAAEVAVNNTPARIHASGSVTFDGDAPTLDVAARWTNLQWPLDGTAVASSTAGNLTLRGPLPYDYDLTAHVAVPAELTKTAQPLEADAQARGMLNRDGFTMREYTLQSLDGSITGSASLQLAQPRAWTLSARAARINPGHLNAEFGGNVSFNLDARGEGLDRQALFAANLAGLTGTLRGQPVRGNGRLERSRSGWRARNVALQFGDAHGSVNGVINDTIDVDLAFKAPSLQTLLPQARGHIEIVGSAKGTTRAPHVVAKINGDDLQYGEWRIATVTADGDVDLSGRNSSRLSVVMRSAGQAEPFIESLHIDGHGVATNHQMDISIVGIGDAATPAPRVNLRIDGRYADQTWGGTLLASDISNGRKSGEALTMPQPASFLIARDRLSVDKLCLALGHGQFCAAGKWQRNGPWEGTVSGYEIPLAVVLPPSGPEAEYSGRIEGRVHASGTPGQPWLLDAGARIIDAAIIYKPPGADPETLNLGNGGLSATATAAKFDFSLGIQAFEDTFLYANAHIARNGSNDLLHLPLTGDVRARAADANILPIVFT
ncbi:MAG TPA: hypothetical protein VKB34_22855, partial [Povalibacter sp.]|nr:hypothetical protein [Povalibacter sp.]